MNYYIADHLGTPRLTVSSSGAVVETLKLGPFGEAMDPASCAQRQQFTVHEHDALTNLDYMHARLTARSTGRFLSPDPVRGQAEAPATWNAHSYVGNSPLIRSDPDGRNWFFVDGRWERHKGNKYKGKTSAYTHLVRFEKSGVNELGAATGKLTLFAQNKEVLTATAFSGGNGSSAIPNGTYMLRLDIRGTASSSRDLKPDGSLKQHYGIQQVAEETGHRYEWGSIRASLNRPKGEDRINYLGNYIHGKQRSDGDYTHGCICNRDETILQELLNLTDVPRVPVEVN